MIFSQKVIKKSKHQTFLLISPVSRGDGEGVLPLQTPTNQSVKHLIELNLDSLFTKLSEDH